MKYIKLFETPDGTYQPDIQEIIFNEINYPISGSYILFFPRLFNLSYADFMRMVRDRYNATLKGKSSYMTFIFKNKQEALEQLKEQLNDESGLLKTYEGENNILPTSYVITFKVVLVQEFVNLFVGVLNRFTFGYKALLVPTIFKIQFQTITP